MNQGPSAGPIPPPHVTGRPGQMTTVMQAMAQASLQRRMARPEEMTGAVVFLAPEASSFTTGQVMPFDGGLVAH